MIHRHRGNRRDQTELKAERKERIVRELGGYWSYPHFGQYRKGKIHCSCPMCAAKTNTKLNKSQGPVSMPTIHRKDGTTATHVRGCRMAVTNGRHGKKNYKISDLRTFLRMTDEIENETYA